MSGSMWQGMKTRHGDGTEALSEEMERNGSATPKSRRHPLTLPPDVWDSAAFSSSFLASSFSCSQIESQPAHTQVTQTVGAPSEAWRFLQGESPYRTRPNQPFVPSVAVMKENANIGSRYTVYFEKISALKIWDASNFNEPGNPVKHQGKQGHKTLTPASEQHH